MIVSPEWISAVVAALMMGGAIGRTLERRRTEARQAMPIFRTEWSEDGTSVKLTIANRLDEDIYVTKLEGEGNIADYGSMAEGRSISLDWIIAPGRARWDDFRVAGGCADRWLRVTVSSSSRTLRSRRFVVRDNQKM